MYLVLKHVQYLSIKLTLSAFILNIITTVYTKTAVDSKIITIFCLHFRLVKS